MSASEPMPSARRRPIPGMATHAPAVAAATLAPQDPPAAGPNTAAVKEPPRPDHAPQKASPGRRRAADYSATRLVNFRLPVDLHDRFRTLVREAEQRHPRLRKQSLTELVVALLEEGPQSADEVAELIRRKRLAEHEER